LLGEISPKETETSASMPDQARRFSQAAETFCRSIEHAGQRSRGSWLVAVNESLLRLQNDMRELDAPLAGIRYSMLADLEQRFMLFQQLKEKLGELDEYWSEADLGAGDGVKTGSLADDLTDIYFDLKRGLALLYSGNAEQAARMWLISYQTHWRRHLEDAIRQLPDFLPVDLQLAELDGASRQCI
jgi:hypothetical protein